MTSATQLAKWVVSLVLIGGGLALSVPLYRYADADDSPGGMVIALGIFVAATALGLWVSFPRARK
jgi:hypothetical protein